MRSLLVALLPILLAAPPCPPPRSTVRRTRPTCSARPRNRSNTWCAAAGGCFTSGEIGPFGRVGAILEGKASESGDVVSLIGLNAEALPP
jgi:hypothetical protein